MGIGSLTAKHLETWLRPRLEQLPAVGHFARSRGWPFLLVWAHRITGLVLVVYLWFHVYTLSFLTDPAAYDAKMRILRFFLFVLLEWALAVPVIFHALNGARLILYESFGVRNDPRLIRWVLGLGTVYCLVLGVLMALGNQNVTPALFWLGMSIGGIGLGYLVAVHIWPRANATGWKLQRISGAFLLIMVPAHLLFMHLQPSIGHEAAVVTARMQSFFIKLVDLTLVLAVAFHGGYGLFSIAKDYCGPKALHTLWAVLIFAVMAGCAWAGITLTLRI